MQSERADFQPFVTEFDFQHASLPPETIRFLGEVMPSSARSENGEDGEANGTEKTFDCKQNSILGPEGLRSF